jgi:DNA polymerase-1
VSAIVFDIETGDANRRYAEPPEKFFRIGGAAPVVPDAGMVGYDPHITDDYDEFHQFVLYSGHTLIGHNILAFDLPALGVTDLLERAKDRKVIDTWTLATVMDTPPDSYQPREGKRRWIAGSPEKAKAYYALDNLAFQYGVGGKTNDLKALAKEWGGFGEIPTDDPEYRDYLRGDVVASRALIGAMLARFGQLTEYHWREMRVAAVLSTVSTNGFRLDQEFTQEHLDHNAAIREQNVAWLAEHYGLPMTNKAGKPSKNPIATQEGKRAILEAFYAAGVRPGEIKTTPKGDPSLGSDSLNELVELHSGNETVERIADTVAGIQGLRTVYGTAMDSVHADGFCHPDLFSLQASGRISTQNPGLTVFGKRDGKYVERDIFTGDVLPSESDDFHVVFPVDFSQIDARAVAVLSQDYTYMDMFADGIDLHVENAIAAFGRQAYDLDPKGSRQASKAIGHGWNYGLGLDKLAKLVGMARAAAFREMMNYRYPRLVQWKRECAEEGAATGRIDNGFGRIMKVDPERAYTQGPALRGQGAARDLMFEAILRMDHQVVRMIKALVHDEIVFSAPISIARDVQQHAIECMSFEWAPAGANRSIQIKADASPFALRWGGCYA